MDEKCERREIVTSTLANTTQNTHKKQTDKLSNIFTPLKCTYLNWKPTFSGRSQLLFAN